MAKAFYAKLAGQNLLKNKKIYIPFILTSTITVMMLYMIIALSDNPGIEQIMGGADLQMMLGLGVIVVELFAIIFLFYTHSFLLKRRKQEFGLYCVLGMEKWHLARLMFYELLYCLLISLGLGLVLGIVLDKLFFLMIIKMLGESVPLGFYISETGIGQTGLYISLIYLLMFLYSSLQIRINKPIELLHSSQMAEKEPKVKWVWSVLGLVFLAAGYGISLYITNPIEAMILFFVAVIFVIVGTYLLFTTGSIALLKGLEKNKGYYYRIDHFLSVSNMKFRMKQNAVSLGNICILSTMVLVMLSSTITMWTGLIDMVNQSMSNDYEIFISFSDWNALSSIEAGVERYKQLAGIEHVQGKGIAYFESPFQQDGSSFTTATDVNHICYLNFLDRDEYRQITNQEIDLNQEEVLVYGLQKAYENPSIDINGKKFIVKENLSDFPIKLGANYMGDVYYIVVSDHEVVAEIRNQVNAKLHEANYDYTQLYSYWYGYDEKEYDPANSLNALLNEALQNSPVEVDYVRSKASVLTDLRSLYAGFLFIGIFLSILFVMAAILIMYYKQISEGYEDQKRFDVMKKVGLDQKQIRKTIQSQVLIMFFLPLLVAGLHVIFAMPILQRLLRLLSLNNVGLFIWTTAACFGVFSLIYIAIYSITAKEYYSIVSAQ